MGILELHHVGYIYSIVLERYNTNAGTTVFDTCSLKSAGVLDHFRDYLER